MARKKLVVSEAGDDRIAAVTVARPSALLLQALDLHSQALLASTEDWDISGVPTSTERDLVGGASAREVAA